MTKLLGFIKRPAVIAALVFCCTATVFWPVTRLGFINFDDPEYVTENSPVLSGLTVQGSVWAFTTGHAANWHPLTWLSHMLDCELYGLQPRGHHLTSLLFHAATAALLFTAFYGMTHSRWRSAVVALLFALHPLRVESVAWISERKDVLCGFWFALTLLFYSNFCRAGDQASLEANRRWFSGLKSPHYWLGLLCFALGLMSKPMLVTVPFVLLLLDVWPLQRMRLESGLRRNLALISEKIPFFILSAASSYATFHVQKTGGAVSTVQTLGIQERIGNALVSYVRYIWKTLWPADLSIFYPHPGSWPAWQVIGSLVLLLVITVLVVMRIRREPFLFTGWFWFIGMLVPVIGIVQVGSQSIADRYTYLPGIGLAFIVTWSGATWIGKGKHLYSCALGLAGVSLTILALLVGLQIGSWSSSETVFRNAIRHGGDNAIARFCLGNSLLEKGLAAEGLAEIERSARLDPNYPNAHGKLGYTAALGKDFDSAVREYEIVLKLRPDFPEALNNYAWLLATCPDPKFHDGKRAVALASKACALSRYEQTIYMGTLAAAYARAGEFGRAVMIAEKAINNAEKWNESKLLQTNRALLELYRKGMPCQEE